MPPNLLGLLLLASATPLTGTVDVDGLGKLSLPAGEWTLERVHTPTEDGKTPDCYVFKKLGPRVERLTILRYRPEIAPTKPVYLCDMLGDSFWHGIPYFMDDDVVRHDPTTVTLRKPRDWYASSIELSYLYTSQDEGPWMCHAVLEARDRFVLVYVHSSSHVLSPGDISDVSSGSWLLPIRRGK